MRFLLDICQGHNCASALVWPVRYLDKAKQNEI